MAVCVRCGAVIERADRGSAAARTAAAALGALVLFFPAVLMPILEIEQLGHRHASSILAGTIELLAHGNWFVGLVVLAVLYEMEIAGWIGAPVRIAGAWIVAAAGLSLVALTAPSGPDNRARLEATT